MASIVRRWWLVAPVLLLAAPPLSAQPQQIQLEEYLSMHDYADFGYLECGYNPATPAIWVCVDTFGSRIEYFGGTGIGTVAGGVTVRARPDGTGDVTVLVRFAGAACWANDSSIPATVFGANARQIVQEGATPALGQGILRIEFGIPSPDAPLPPLWEVGTEAYPMYGYLHEAHCRGALAATSGYPAGTPGMAQIVQRSLPATGVPAPGCPGKDCWPVELAFYKALGK